RRHKPDAVLHLGRVGNLRVRTSQRFDLNVVGTAKIQEECVRHKVKRLVVLSTYHIYGAHPHNHVPILEEEPIRALQTVPQLSDAIQMDTQAVTWTYRHRGLKTMVLRATNVIGPNINNTTSRLLRLRRIPYLAGYNPMWQFIYETDMVEALILAMGSTDRGVFNVAGRGSLPIVEALKETGAPLVPVPAPLLRPYVRLDPIARRVIPPYLFDFLRYPVVIGDRRFRDAVGFDPEVSIPDAVRACSTRIPVA
ncbi:MAG: NAD-dependent epimerase/dehydratase family protein, partial [Myxococcota bacterium]|nr:NAD-dependent epimerase/dehydratase family protein [Myxococcota bacterium]